ncbi:unnamed protein product (mitochondrion) [Plasmodiophora brassicae]|uniref:Uncharacterized protein n=1 Tax=Plasmodiophora brassicae TaxID=37360 RepID=A0A3P3YCA8_PLABS|nr:unnamed protein product [Plasmodiophora brassicae]
MMFGGDDVGALVIDTGSLSTKTGFAGENIPKAVVPSFIGRGAVADGDDVAMRDEDTPAPTNAYVGQNLYYRRDNVEVTPAVEDGSICDFDATEAIWRHSVESILRIDATEHPLLLVESVFNTAENREKMCEIAMERFQCPAVFIAKDAVLSAFAAGRSTALVLQCGAGITSSVAVHEGYALMQGKLRTRLAGNTLDDVFVKLLSASSNHPIEPHFMFKRELASEGRTTVKRLDFPLTTASYTDFMRRDVIRDIKHSVVRVSDVPFSSEVSSAIPTVPYELPDGHVIDVGAERFTLGEQLFNPSASLVDFKEDIDGYKFEGLPAMVRQAVDAVDVDVRRELYGNIVVTGGTSSIRGLSDRLTKELMATAAPAFKIKTLSVGTHHERLFGSWIGASILGSLGSFQQMWFSRSEYEEHGARYIAEKCP